MGAFPHAYRDPVTGGLAPPPPPPPPPTSARVISGSRGGGTLKQDFVKIVETVDGRTRVREVPRSQFEAAFSAGTITRDSGGRFIVSEKAFSDETTQTIQQKTPLKSPKPEPTPIKPKSNISLDPMTGDLTSKNTGGLLISRLIDARPAQSQQVPDPTLSQKIYGSIIPGFEKERIKFETEKERIRKIEQERLDFQSQLFSEITSKQAQAKLEKERRASSQTLIEEKAGIQGIITQAAIDKAAVLQEKVDLGLIDVSTAQSQLDTSTAQSQKLAQSQLDISTQIEQRRLLSKSERATINVQEQYEKDFIPFIEPKIKESEQRIQSNISKNIFGSPGVQVGSFGLDLFVSTKVPALKKVIEAKAFERDLLISRAEDLKSQRTIPLKDIKKGDFSAATFKEFNIAQQQIGAQIGITKAGTEIGLFTKPATTAISLASIATLGFGTALVAPKIIQAAAKGSTIAKVVIGTGKATSYGLGIGFLGVQGVRAGLAPTRLQKEIILGETIGIGTAALVGGAVGSKAGGKLLNLLSSRKPAITTFSVTQKEVVKGISISKFKGKVTRGKYEFEFTGKEAEGIGKGFRFAKTAEIKPTFAGRKLKTIKIETKGKLQPGDPDVGASFFGGGKTFRTGDKLPQSLDFRVFKGGEVYGKIGRGPFKSKLLGEPKVKGDITTFKIVEISAGQPRVHVKRSILDGFTLPGKLFLGIGGAKPLPFGSFIPRTPGAIGQPKAITKIKPISTRIKGGGFAQVLEIPTIQGKGVIPSLVNQNIETLNVNTSITKIDLLNTGLFSSTISDPTSKLTDSTQTIIDAVTKGGSSITSKGGTRGGTTAGTTPTDLTDVISGTIVEPITETTTIVETELTPRTTNVARSDFLFNLKPPTFTFGFLGLPLLPKGAGGGGVRGRRKGRGRVTKYQPSLSAVGLNIFGKKAPVTTGLQYRPIPITLKPKKVKKKKKGLLNAKVGFRL